LKDFQPDELRWLSRRWRARLGGTESRGWPVALRRHRRRGVSIGLLRPAARHAGLWRHHVTRRDLESDRLHPCAARAKCRSDAEMAYWRDSPQARPRANPLSFQGAL